MPTFEEFITSRDYTGALTLLEFNSKSDEFIEQTELWRAFCHFRLAEYKKALEVYKRILAANKEARSVSDQDIELFCACCKFFSGEYMDPSSFDTYTGENEPLANRIRIYLNRKKDFKEDNIEEIQAKLSTVSGCSDFN